MQSLVRKINLKSSANVAALSTASIYGVIVILTTLLAVDGDEFTYLNIIVGAISVGLIATITLLINRVINKELIKGSNLIQAEYLEIFILILPLWLFPILSIVVGISGLMAGIASDTVINLLYIFGFLTVLIAGTIASYAVRNDALTSIFRASIWSLMFLLLMAVRRLSQ